MTVEWRDGDVVRKLRMTAGWTLKTLFKKSGVGVQVIHRLEKGITKEAKRKTLKRIAGAFGLTEQQLRDAVPRPIELPIAITLSEKKEPRRRRA